MRASARLFPAVFAALLLCASAGPGHAQTPPGMQAAAAPQELRVIRVTPEGADVPASHQIVIEFNRPVVPVGRMDRTAEQVGVTIAPPLACQWRWLNTSSLACNLPGGKAMKAATKYSVAIAPVIAAEDGGRIAQAETHAFTTQRPFIKYANFSTWRGPGWPVVRIVSDLPLAHSAVAAHVYFKGDAPGAGARYAVKVTPDKDYREDPVLIPLPGGKGALFVGGGKTRGKDKPVKTGTEEARRVWLVEPQRELPSGAAMALWSEPGLATSEGPEKSAEKKDIVHFFTYPAFSFVGVKCTSNKDEDILLAPGKKQGADQLCDPLQPVSLAFTAPVLRSEAKRGLTLSPPLSTNGAVDPWGDENRDWSRLDAPRANADELYYVGLPVGLKAAQAYTLGFKGDTTPWWRRIVRKFRHEKPLPGAVRDEFGRSLPGVSGFSFRTDHRRPNFELDKHDVVLEKGVDSELPFYVNNLDSYRLDFSSLDAAGGHAGQQKVFAVPKPLDVQFAVPLGIRDALGGRTGALFGAVSATPAVDKSPGESRLFAEVTPWQIQFKAGHEASLAWLTDLATGRPVPGVSLSVYSQSFPALAEPGEALAQAVTGEDGTAILPGTATLDPDLRRLYSWDDAKPHLFLRAEKDGDMALLPLTNDFEINTWNVADNVSSYSRDKYGLVRAWGMTAQGVYRAGDTMQYKIFVRGQGNTGLVPPPEGDYTLEIGDALGNTVEKVAHLKLSEFGTYAGEYKIPATAPVGWYTFHLSAAFEKQEEGDKKRSISLEPLRVLVSDFTPASFHVENSLNGDLFKAGDTMEMSADAKLHSGGAYTQASVRTTVTLVPDSFESKDPAAQGFVFDGAENAPESEDIYQKSAPLDAQGEWKDSFVLPEKNIVYGHLTVESAVQDDRGKAIAASSRAAYLGVDRLVGLKQTQWVYPAGQQAVVKMIVVDADGKPAPGVAVKAEVEREVISTARVKGAGNAYLSDITREWKQAAACEEISAAEAVDCGFTPAAAGSYRMTAHIVDSKGRAHSTQVYLWVSGSDYVQWNDQSDLALQILPERTDYKVGDTARFLIKNPYPGASALVTVERYGVIDSFTQVLEGSTPVIEIPIKPDYVPGFYLSVVVTSPRVDAPPAQIGQVDMGKPAFRMGYAAIEVADPYKQMKVTAQADQEVYRPRDKVKVKLNAVPLNAPDAPQPAELAVAVLDDAVFDLISGGRRAFDPYAGFYKLESLDMRNYSLMMRLIGRQKFEKKGANPGGDGGGDVNMRTLFKFVSYWNPSVPVDKDGNAEIAFDAPDNLTGWHILALAVTPGDRMGLGEASFKVNRPTEIRPVMPNQVREGDDFSAGFSVTNRTDHARKVAVKIAASGDVRAVAEGGTLTKTEALELAPYERRTVLFPLQAAMLEARRETPSGEIAFDVTAGDDEDKDGVHQDLPVLKSRTLQVGADYGTTTEPSVSTHISVPKDIYPDSGALDVMLAPSVLGNLEGAFAYLRDYPYDCWEQLLTRAVMAAHYTALKAYLPDSFKWPDSGKLPQETLDRAAEYQAPGGGMAYFLASDDRADPYLSAYTAIAFGWLEKDGYKLPDAAEGKLEAYLQNFLREDAAPDFYQEGMKSTVRAVALSALAAQGKADKEDLARYRPHVREMSLFGKAEYLLAALAVKDADPTIAKETATMILASGNETGGKFMFSETYNDGYSRILATPLRDNCAILSAFSAYALTEEGKELVGDKPFRLVRMITQTRGNRDHWENTQENMFCMTALADYARAYESEKPDMTVTASFGESKIGAASFDDVRDAPVTLSHPFSEADIGAQGSVTLARSGKGRLYFANRLSFALKGVQIDPVDSGIDIRREYSVRRDGAWHLLSGPAQVRRGDLVRVDLFLSLPAPRNFVVVNDPLPGGLETVNTDLATASNVDDAAAPYDKEGGSWWFHFGDWSEYNASLWSFYHRELRADSVRFYSDWLPAGNYHLSYAAQAIAEGSFDAPPVRAEEMYDPDVYGLGAEGRLNVGAAP